MFQRFWTLALAAGLGLASAGVGSTRLHAQTGEARVTAQFGITVAGVTIGRGAYEAAIGPDGYSIAVSARLSGLAALVSPGEGQASARGTHTGDRSNPASYTIENSAGDWRNKIDMLFRGGNVAELAVEPPTPPHPERVPLIADHRRGVMDPLSALIFPVAGTGETLRPEACNRTLRIFDGRQRYDITLTHKRTENVRRGDVEGPVLVCAARYRAIAGHRLDLPGPKRLEESRDLEAWLAPVQGTRALIVFRMIVGTTAGRMTIEARSISVMPAGAPAATR